MDNPGKKDEQNLPASEPVVSEPKASEAPQEPKQPEAPQFDPSKIDTQDAEQMERLSAEQLQEVEDWQEQQKAKPADKAEPDAPPAKDTEKEDTSKEDEKPDETSSSQPETKLAGKYSTFDELIKGVEQLTEKLGYKNTALQAVIEAAKENKAVKTVEKLYKQLEVEMGRKANEKTAAEPESSPEQSDTFDADTSSQQELLRQVTALTYQQLAGSQLASQMRARGLEIPTTPEQLETLIDTNPYFAMQFETEFKTRFNNNLSGARAYTKAQKEAPERNKQAIDSGVSTVKDFAGSHGITLTEQELDALRLETLGNPFNYEERHGVKFLRQNAMRDTFMAVLLPQKLAEMKNALLTQGREEALKDMEKNRHREVRSISTSGKPTTKDVVSKKPIDENDPEQIAALSDADLERYGT